MKVAVFENELEGFKNSFEAINLLYFDGSIDYKFYPKFESMGSTDKIPQFDFVIIDLELAPKSQYDGFQVIDIIEEVKHKQESDNPKILILSGKKDLLETLKREKDFGYPILYKPIDYEKFSKELAKP